MNEIRESVITALFREEQRLEGKLAQAEAQVGRLKQAVQMVGAAAYEFRMWNMTEVPK